MRAAIDAILNGSLDPTPLYTHRFSLNELGEAFEMLRLRPKGFVKALVLP
jgi:threonine dehydrogenase-like Zn-dependent dehydrogenase